MKPTNIEINGNAYTVNPPTGLDWIETADKPDFERTVLLLQRCVVIDGRPAFATYQEAAAQELPLLLQLERALSQLLEFDIPDPTSARSQPRDGLSISA